MKKNKTGKCLIIFGLSGSGKSTLSKLILTFIEKKIGKTILIDGDNFRDLLDKFDRKFGFSKSERSKSAIPVYKILNILLNQNINILYNTVGLNKYAHNLWNRKIKNLLNIYIKSDVKKIISFGAKKNIYKLDKDVVGVHIKPYLPKKIDITINNRFDRSLNQISKELIQKLRKKL